MQIKLLVDGGSMQPGPALSQKLGPAGINIGQVIQKVNDSTKNFKGMKVPVEIEIDVGKNEIEVKVFSPPVAELLKKELKIEKGSGMQKKLQVANASIEQIISVAKTKFPNMLCRNLKAAVKSVIGTCVSLGILVEGKPASEIEEEIDAGKYDSEISKEKTETSPEKKAELERFFLDLKNKQELLLKQEAAAEEAKAAEAEKEKAVAATTSATATATSPVATAKPSATAKSPETPSVKKEEKKK